MGDLKSPKSSFRGFSPEFWEHSGLKPQLVLFEFLFPRAEARSYSYRCSVQFVLRPNDKDKECKVKKFVSFILHLLFRRTGSKYRFSQGKILICFSPSRPLYSTIAKYIYKTWKFACKFSTFFIVISEYMENFLCCKVL